MNISGIKLFWGLFTFIVAMVILSNYIPGKLVVFITCISLMILILFSVFIELRREKIADEFDELIMNSKNIDDTLVELYNQNKYKNYVYEYIENKKFITENDNEIIVNNKSNVFLIKITKDGIEYKDFFKKKVINYDNILSIDDSSISTGKGSLRGIIINLKDQKDQKNSKLFGNIFSGKKVFIPWENGSSLPIRRVPLIYKITKYLENNNITLAS